MFHIHSFTWLRCFRRVTIFTITIGSIVGLSIAAAQKPKDTTLESALRKDLSDYLKARSSIEHTSTLSLAVSFRGDPHTITMAVGTMKYGGGNDVTSSSLFQTGSNTKAFTAVLILQLEEAGVLSINDTVGKWLPQYPAWGKVTIKQLLNMTSGIPTYDDTVAWQKDYSSNPMMNSTPEQLVAYVYPKIKTPGAAFAYSNTGYMLAQMIIDKLSPTKSYEHALNALIAHADLKHTFYASYFYPPSLAQRVVSGYEVNTDDPHMSTLLGKDTSGFSLGWAQSAGGMISTPEDLTLWVRELFEGKILPPKQLAELTSLVAIPSGQPIPETSSEHRQAFGLGVFQIIDPSLGLFWGYQGSTIGYRAAYSYFPKTGLIICVFTNSQPTAAENKMNTILFKTIDETLKAHGKV